MPNAHYISRAHGGLGIEENIVTLCLDCHNNYDNGRSKQESDCIKEKKLSDHYLINIDQNNLIDSIKLWNINLNAELSEQITNFNK